jgi:hypothetical protein
MNERSVAPRRLMRYVSALSVEPSTFTKLPGGLADCPACVAAGYAASWLQLAEDKQGQVFLVCSQATRRCGYISAVPQNDVQAARLFAERCPRCQGPLRLCLPPAGALPFLVCCERPACAGVVWLNRHRHAGKDTGLS